MSIDEPAVRRPVMPTVNPPVASAPRAIDETEVVAAATRAWQSGDEAAARQLIARSDDRAQRVRIVTAMATQLAGQDPARAARFAVEAGPEAGQRAAIEVVAGVWAEKDADAALRWAHGLAEPESAGLARRTVAQRLVQTEPRATIERIMALPAGAGRDDLLGFAAASWARSDADAAMGWVRTLPEGDLRQRMTSTVGFEMALHQPERAIALAETLPVGRNRWLLFSAIAQTWVATDSKAALAWAGRLPEGEARAAAFSGLDTGLGVPTGRRSIRAPGSRGVRSRGLGGGVGEAALAAGASADFAAWLATQPSGRSRDEAILEYVQQRGASDSGQIGQWLASLSPGPTRDRAMEIYLEGQLIGSPHRAASWLRSLPRSDRSDAMIERTARAWLLTNPDAAQAWLLETPLPPDRKERLLREAGR